MTLALASDTVGTMSISVKGQQALRRVRFAPGAFAGHIYGAVAERLAPTPEYGSFRQRKDANEDHLTDILIGLSIGYDGDRELFESWDGRGMDSFVDHVIESRDEDNLLHAAFGLARGLEENLVVRDVAGLAGAARMSAYRMSIDLLPPREAKFDPKSIPLRNTCADIEAEMLLRHNRDAESLLSLLEGMTAQQKYKTIDNIRPDYTQAYDFAVLMYTCGVEHLDVSRALHVWALVKGTTGRNLDFVLRAVRSHLADEYISELVEKQDGPGAAW